MSGIRSTSHGDRLGGEMKGNHLPGKLKLRLTAFVVYPCLATKLELQRKNRGDFDGYQSRI